MSLKHQGSNVYLDSVATMSTTLGDLTVCPFVDLAPLMAWIEDRRRENTRRQRSQQRVLVYDDSHFGASIDARCLKNTVASLPMSAVVERTKGVKVECSIS